jgi:[protein-PII] uridylyltransferase
LFWELYQATLRTLRRGFANPIDEEELIEDRQARALELLNKVDGADEFRATIWTAFSHEYYLRHTPAEIAWHTQMLAENSDNAPILVSINSEIAPANTLVSIYAPKELHSFARTTAVLDDCGLDVVDARIVPLDNDHSLDTFTVLGADGRPVTERRMLNPIRERLQKALLTADSRDVIVSRRVPRIAKAFKVPVEIDFSRDPKNERTVVGIVAGDRPGLLLQIGAVFEQHGVIIQTAKISTIGERAEDVFFITTVDGQPLTDPACETLGAALREALRTSRK